MGIANAKLMMAYQLMFNIGANLLARANRTLDKEFASEKCSGDTVTASIMDGGDVYDQMDLTGKDLRVKRDEVPITVRPLVTAGSVDIEELTLSISNPELMAKRVAKQAMEGNLRGFRTLARGAQAFVVPSGLEESAKNESIKRLAFKAQANTTGSKIGGKTYGITHPFTHNELTNALQANFGANPSIGQKLFQNELGNFMGFDWSVSTDVARVVAPDNNLGNVQLIEGSQDFNYSGDGPTTTEFLSPFTLAGCYNVDTFGNPTGMLKTFTPLYDNKRHDFVLSEKVFSTGPRKNVHVTSNEVFEDVVTPAVQLLTANSAYYSPAVIYKEEDFLVAMKGVVKFFGCDSYSVPKKYVEKGNLPLRGTVWADPQKAVALFRSDVLLGTALYQGVSVSSLWIPEV